MSKPLGIRAYGSIPHLPGSRRGPADKGLSEDQARICTHKARDSKDLIVVQEKLDGSCVSVARIENEIVPLIRAGYHARESHYPQHHYFADWVAENHRRFIVLLKPGERAVGEWLLQAHGTIYDLPYEPFVIFDLMRGHDRATAWEVISRVNNVGFHCPWLLHSGSPIDSKTALSLLGPRGFHGAVDEPEGAVWRVEREGKVDFLGKFVKPSKQDGSYLESVTGAGPRWNKNPWKIPPSLPPVSNDQTHS